MSRQEKQRKSALDRLRAHPHEFLVISLPPGRRGRQFLVFDARNRGVVDIEDHAEHCAAVVFLVQRDALILTPEELFAGAIPAWLDAIRSSI